MYAGESPRSICNVPRYLLERWDEAGILKPKLKLEKQLVG
jgi:hypothetical protein